MRLYDDFQVVTQGDSFLMGITYYGKNDVAEEDWAELNINIFCYTNSSLVSN